MKILNINSYYYSSSVHRELQNIICNYGIDSKTYVPLFEGYVPRKECQYEEDYNVKTSICYRKIDRYFFHIKHHKILIDINKYINDYADLNCLHAHSLFSNGYIAMKMKQRYGIPYIVAVRDTDLNTFFKYMYHLRSLGKKVIYLADKIVFLSKPYRDYLIDKYVSEKYKKRVYDKSIIIPNGINSNWIRNKGIVKNIKKKKDLKLLYVGAISKRKNLKTTVKAIQLLINKGYDVKFTIVGKIIDKVEFSQIKDLSYVNYIPPKSKEELLKIYRENDIFIMPSITETFGLVYAEAMSQGLPVIYTKGQGFDGHFEEGKIGFSVSCFDHKDIADKVIKILNNYYQISKFCIENVDYFNWDRIAKEYVSLYSEII